MRALASRPRETLRLSMSFSAAPGSTLAPFQHTVAEPVNNPRILALMRYPSGPAVSSSHFSVPHPSGSLLSLPTANSKKIPPRPLLRLPPITSPAGKVRPVAPRRLPGASGGVFAPPLSCVGHGRTPRWPLEPAVWVGVSPRARGALTVRWSE